MIEDPPQGGIGNVECFQLEVEPQEAIPACPGPMCFVQENINQSLKS